MEKKITNKKFHSQLSKLQDNMEKNIVDVLTQQGIKAISFIHNGDNSDFDVDRSFAYIEYGNNDVAEYEVVILLVDSNKLFVATEDSFSYEDLTVIADKGDIFSPKGWDNLNLQTPFEEMFSILTDETFAPITTLIELVDSVKEVVEELMEGKPLDNGEIKILA